MLESSRRRYQAFRQAYKDGRTDLGSEDTLQPERRDRTERRRYLRQYIRWLGPYWKTVAGLIALALAGAALETLHPLFLRYIVDDVLLADGLGRGDRLSALHVAGATFLAVVLVGQVFELWRNYRQRILNTKVQLTLRRALYDRILRLPLRQLHEMKTGGVISRVTGDVDTTSGLMQLALISPAVSAIRLLVAFAILFWLNWKLALTALAVLPGLAVVSFWSAKRIRPIYRGLRKDSAEVDARISEATGGIRVVRAFQREGHELLQFLVGRHTMVRKQLFAHRRELALWTSWGVMLAAVNVVIVWLGGYLQITATATIGDIMAFQWYTFLLLTPVWQIVNSFSEMQRSLAAMERVFEVLESPLDLPDHDDSRPAPATVESIDFEHVSFAYKVGTAELGVAEDVGATDGSTPALGEPVLSDLHVHIPGGSVVALVGRSGAGKSTVADLVARFFDPTEGRILLNGTDLRQFELDSFRQLIGVVQQDVFLFDGTVRDNIAYGRPSASNGEVADAARRANAEEFILELPDGYQTKVGERGVKLSGGQCQRLSIARAILAKPQILILDEATSALDTESEQRIQSAMREVFAGRTTFVVAHRLSTISHADIILVLDEGKIIERGRHEELMTRRGHYFDMVRRQHDATSAARSTGD